MSKWTDHELEARILAALTDVPVGQSHAFGRPWMTAYQLTIKLETAHPGMAAQMDHHVGGQGAGNTSQAQYIARELSRRIGRGDPIAQLVEGGFLTNQHVDRFIYDAPDGTQITSTLTGSGFDLSMFRLIA